MKRPHALKNTFTIDEWNNLTEDEQKSACEARGIQTSDQVRQALKAPTVTFAQPAVVGVGVKQAPAVKQETSESSEPKDIRDWDESCEGISAERLRNCIIYMLDVKKDEWYTNNMSRGFVRRMAKRLDEDTPEGFKFDPDPLFETKERSDDEGTKYSATVIRRDPKTAAERKKIREKCGVTFKTVPFLVKKDCPTCKGTGQYSVSSYPDDPFYRRLEEFHECPCLYE